MKFTTLLGLFVSAVIQPPMAAAQSGPVPLEIFGTPLGATIDDMRGLVRSRGHTMQPDKTYMEWPARIDGLEQTRYITALTSYKQAPDKREFVGAFFMAPDNEQRTWAAGMWSEFGNRFKVSASAPLERDVVQALVRKYGPQAYDYKDIGGGGQRYLWFWNAQGVPLRGQVAQQCAQSISQVGVVGPGLTTGNNNAVAFTQPIVNARKLGCAFGFDATVGAVNGAVVLFKTRAVNFMTAYQAWQRSVRYVNGLKGQADAQRSAKNRPDF